MYSLPTQNMITELTSAICDQLQVKYYGLERTIVNEIRENIP